MSGLINSTFASATASQLSSSSVVVAVTSKPQGYIVLENELAKIGDIANHIAPLAKKDNKTEEDFYAISYGLILMGEMINQIREFKSTAYNQHLNQLGIDYKFPPSGDYSLENTLETIIYIRNMLTHHFIRIKNRVKI